MSTSAARTVRSLAIGAIGAIGVVAAFLLARIGMGGEHVPVGIAPDAPHAEGTQVATFALG